jgi:hypothetical protein
VQVATNLISQFLIGSGGGGGTEAYINDVYINNDIGSVCAGRQGDTVIRSYKVNAAGTYAQFNRGGTDTGSNQGQLNKLLADPTSYNVDNVVNHRDSFAMAAVPAPVTSILGARLWSYTQKENIGSRQIAFTMESGGVDNIGQNLLVSGPGYGWLTQDASIDPATGALWASNAPINAAKFGYKITV